MSDSPAPEISIIIPVYNCLEYTVQCLQSLDATIGDVGHEIILVDDGSTDGSRDYFAQLPTDRFTVILNEENLGYGKNNNKAAARAKGKFLLLLNNDTVLLPGWLPPMLDFLRTHPECGGIGNIQINPKTGLIDHAGIFFDLRGVPHHVRKNRGRFPKEDYTSWNAVTACCFLIPRELFLEFKGFDEAFKNGSEDVDLCIRLRLAGYPLYVANRSVIHHFVSTSPGRLDHAAKNSEMVWQRWHQTTSEWGKDEWPAQYFRRYARHWWKMTPGRFCRACYYLLRQKLRHGSSGK